MSPERRRAHGSSRPVSAAVGALAILLVSGCSSKNPDSLIGSNLDENVVMMNAHSNSVTNAPAANVAESNASAVPSSAGAAHQSSEAPPPTPEKSSRSEPSPRSDENSISADVANEPTPDESLGNGIGNDEQVPNGV